MRATNVILFLLILLALPAAADQHCDRLKRCDPNPCNTVKTTPETCDRFTGSLSFRTSQGVVKVKVVVRQWQIANRKAEGISQQGSLMVYLCSGGLVADIEGTEPKKWLAGSFWSVPADKSMVVRTERDSVVLQTVDFIEHLP